MSVTETQCVLSRSTLQKQQILATKKQMVARLQITWNSARLQRPARRNKTIEEELQSLFNCQTAIW